jgi:hypothetical protein
MPELTYETVDEAIQTAIAEMRPIRQRGNIAYALTYLEAIPAAMQSFPNEPEHAKRVQVLYALGNMQSWTGPKAKQVKEILKRYAAPGTKSRRG